MTRLDVQPRRILIACLVMAGLLVIAYVATQWYRVRVAPDRLNAAMAHADWPTGDAAAERAAREQIVNPRGLVRMFDLDAEANLPTTWSVLQLAASAGLLVVIGAHYQNTRGIGASAPWFALAVGFLLLALDEGSGMHNGMHVSTTVSEAERRSQGVLYHSWIVPAVIMALAAGLVFLRFLWTLPARTRWLFVLSGVGYVCSAAGGEMAQGWWLSQGLSKIRLSFSAITIVEELGEMLSIAVFLYALLDYMARNGIAITIGAARDRDAAARSGVLQSASAPAVELRRVSRPVGPARADTAFDDSLDDTGAPLAADMPDKNQLMFWP